MKGFPEKWITPKDELYVIDKLWPNSKPLAYSVSERTGKKHAVIWTNQFGSARFLEPPMDIPTKHLKIQFL